MIGPGQFPTGPIYITGFAYRAAPGLGPLSVAATSSIYLSTSPNYPNSTGHPLLSTTFANNVGPDNTLVFSGSATISGAGCAGPAPCPWANNIVFTTPFLYNPANGPLLIDSKDTSLDAASGQFDVADCDPGSCATVNVYTSPIGSPTGKVAYNGTIIQITYISASIVPSLTYNYRGTPFTRCGSSPNCPANYASDYIIASISLAAPLTPNLPLTGELSSLTAWTISDALGSFSFSSTDSAAAAELGSINGCTDMSFSTNSSGNIVDWCMGAGNAEFVGFTINPTFIGGSGLPIADTFLINPGMAQENVTTSTPGQWTETLNTLPTVFTGQVSLGSGVYYLQFPNGNLFGYYNFPSYPFMYHYDLGFEYLFDGGNGAVYMYDFSSGHWFYTSSSLFPYLYDFSLSNWLYYFPATNNPGHYTSNPRYFSDLTTGKIITM